MFRTCVIQTRLSVPTSRAGREFICAVITKGCNRERCIAKPTLIYIQPNVELPLVETEDCLGPMTSELKPGFHIEEFVSGRPKNYGKIEDPVTGNREPVCKVRGITLNYRASQTVNFDVMKAMILRGYDTESHGAHR